MPSKINRREFIKIAGAATGGLAFAAGSVKLIYERISEDDPPVISKTPTYCEICTFQCAGWAYLKNGNPWKIIGNESDGHCYGRLCTRGSAGFGAYNDPDRLRTPLIRTRARGKQVYREASWDEAFSYISEKLEYIKQKYGPESVALFSHGSGGSWFKTLLKAYGTDSFAAPSYANCRGPREEAYMLTFGEPVDSPERTDMRNSKCIVLIGSHIGENTHSQQVNEFASAISSGAAVIAVDPRFSIAAGKAKYWLPIRPGTDTALMLAWMNVLISEKLYDADFVRRYTVGFAELAKHVEGKTPEWAYPITSIEPALIRETARLMAHNSPAALVHPGRNVVWDGSDTQRVRATAILNALLGSWGKPGGFYMPERAVVPDYPHPPYSRPKRDYKDALEGKYAFSSLALSSGICAASVPSLMGEKGTFYKGWIIYGTNLIKSLPEQKKTIEALKSLELVVVIDILPMDITGWADVVLPDTTYLERYDELRISQGRVPQAALRAPALKPKYNSRPAWWIAKNLAQKMGLGDYFQWNSIEDYLDFRLKKIGSSLEEMKRIGVKSLERETSLYIPKNADYKFPTESGKIELYSKQLEASGFNPLPVFTEPDVPGKGFYRLLSGRSPMHSFARTINNPVLSRLMRENEIWIHTSVAREWGISNSQYIKLENQDGVVSLPVKAKVTERIRPDCVFMVHGFGHRQKKLRLAYRKGACDQELMTRVNTDPIMGGQGIHNNFVTFRV